MIIFMVRFVLFCVFSGCCLVVVYLGCEMLMEVMYLYVGSGCRDRNYFNIISMRMLYIGVEGIQIELENSEYLDDHIMKHVPVASRCHFEQSPSLQE